MSFLPPAARRACVILGATLGSGALVSAEAGAAAPAPRGTTFTVVRAMEELRQAQGVEKYGALRAL